MQYLSLIFGLFMAALGVYSLVNTNYFGAVINFAFAALNLYAYCRQTNTSVR